MYMFRLLLVFLSSSLCLSYSQSNSNLATDKPDRLVAFPKLTDQPQSQSLKESNPRKCLCIQQNQLSTTPVQLWDPKKIGIERLVVYLYKTKGTGAVKIYIPNAKKQITIPDLPYENGDNISVQEDVTLKRIFDDSSEVIIRNLDNQKPQYPNIINHYDIDKQDSNKMNPESHNYVIHIVQHATDSPREVLNVDIPEIANSDKKSNTAKVTYKPKISVDANVFNPTFLDFDFTDPGKPILQPLKIRPHVPNHNNEFWKKTNVNTVIQNTDYEKDNTLDITFSKWFNEQMKHMNTDNYETTGSFDISKLKYLIEDALRKSGFHVSDQEILLDSNGSHLNMDNLMLRPLLIGNSVAYENLIKGKETIKFAIPKTWPYLQAVLITTSNPTKVLGMIPLEKTLISKKPSDNLIDLASIHSDSRLLTPPSRIQETYVGRESDLLTTFPDSKIAGDVSKNTMYNGRKQFNEKENGEMTSHAKLHSKNNKAESSQLKQSPLIKNLLHNYYRTNYPFAISTNSLQYDLNFDKNKARSNRDKHRAKMFPLRHQRKKAQNFNANEDRNERWTVRNKRWRNKLIKKYFNSNPNDQLHSSSIDKMFDEVYGDVNDEDKLKIADDYYEDIRFRIVGGGAATGSGAPISNKGRSGEIDVSEYQPVANFNVNNDEDVRLGIKS